MKLYLQACQAVNRTRDYTAVEELAYEFFSQALLIYQDDISDSEAKSVAINLICSTLYNLNCFSEENHNTLLSNAMSSCAQLLKKPAQCEAIINASNLYNSAFKTDGKRVMDQLKKSMKICDVCMTSAKNLYLCVMLLNKYVYYYIYEASFMTAEDINNLMEFIKEHIDGLEDRDSAKDGLKYFENTKKAIKHKAETNERLKMIKIA
jgi:vacuolar protein sorting-associated protein 35